VNRYYPARWAGLRDDGPLGLNRGANGTQSLSPGQRPAAIELRSADFSPLPYRPRETGRGGLKSALLLACTAPNSTAVLRGRGQGFGPELSRTGEGKRRLNSRGVSPVQGTPH